MPTHSALVAIPTAVAFLMLASPIAPAQDLVAPREGGIYGGVKHQPMEPATSAKTKEQGVGYGGTGAAAPSAGATIEGIPDMAIGGPPALDVTKDLQSTAPRTELPMTPHTAPSLQKSVRARATSEPPQ